MKRLFTGLASLGDALSFISRIVQARTSKSDSLGTIVPWLALAGFIIGALSSLAALSVFLLLHIPLPFNAALGAWVWLVLEIWLGCAMHWDGLGDFADAAGSCSDGEKFWEIMKDCHLGVFGTLGIIVIFSGQFLAIASHFAVLGNKTTSLDTFLLLSLSCAWARLMPVFLAAAGTSSPHSSMGSFFCKTVSDDRQHLAISIFNAFIILILLYFISLSFMRICVLVLTQLALGYWFWAKARAHGGLSGDFFGAFIESSQLLFLLLTIP